jgi:hypothetical protein
MQRRKAAESGDIWGRARGMLTTGIAPNVRKRRALYLQEAVMPYILGWFLGVPFVVLVILYLIFH